MKIWLAGNTGVYTREIRIQRINSLRLVSFHYIPGVLIAFKVDKDLLKKKVKK